MGLSHAELVRYCDQLLTPELAVELLLDCIQPESRRPLFKSKCPLGHPLDGLSINQHGHRVQYCRQCRRAAWRATHPEAKARTQDA